MPDVTIVRSGSVLTRFAAIVTDSVDGQRIEEAVSDALLSSEWCVGGLISLNLNGFCGRMAGVFHVRFRRIVTRTM